MALTKKKAAAEAAPATEAVVKKPVEEKKEEKAAAPKKAAAAAKSVLKKAAPKKAAEKAEKVEEVYLQSGGAEWNVSDCKAKAVAAYVAEGHRASSVKKLTVYLKPEEGKAYYVINDDVTGSIDL